VIMCLRYDCGQVLPLARQVSVAAPQRRTKTRRALMIALRSRVLSNYLKTPRAAYRSPRSVGLA
jgi:hypothetical protein